MLLPVCRSTECAPCLLEEVAVEVSLSDHKNISDKASSEKLVDMPRVVQLLTQLLSVAKKCVRNQFVVTGQCTAF